MYARTKDVKKIIQFLIKKEKREQISAGSEEIVEKLKTPEIKVEEVKVEAEKKGKKAEGIKIEIL